MQIGKVEKSGTLIIREIKLSPEERKALTVHKDAWDYMCGTQSFWQVIKRFIRIYILKPFGLWKGF